MASSSDLVSLAELKAWIGLTSTTDDTLLAQLVTEISRAILSTIDRPSVLPTIYAQTFDGRGETAIVLRHWPVLSIASCAINGTTIAAAPALTAGNAAQAGYVLDLAEPEPPGRMHRLSLRGACFSEGIQNISIAYTAGYQISAESSIVPTTPPYVVTVRAPYGAWGSDAGVAYQSGQALTFTAGMPTQGQYSVAAGVYTFAAADAGASLSLNYGFTPADLTRCALEWAAERYVYRSRIGQASKSLGGQETTSFIVKDVPAFVASALQPYRRVIAA